MVFINIQAITINNYKNITITIPTVLSFSMYRTTVSYIYKISIHSTATYLYTSVNTPIFLSTIDNYHIFNKMKANTII